MTGCPVCASPLPAPFLVREPVPVHQNLVMDDAAAARGLNRGTLRLHACERCGFVCNGAFDPQMLSYGAAYDNTQSCSPAFEEYLDKLADYVVRDRSVRNSRIVEIGCGKGGFLKALVERDAGNHGIGFDPSYVGADVEAGGRVRFERRFYDATCADLAADAVVCRHVIEHIPDPVALLRVVRATLGNSSARVFFETPCVEWILRNEVVWDLFYEHCSYFTASSLSTAFARAGFEVDAVRHTFGGQYLWAEARPAAMEGGGAPAAGDVPRLAAAFSRHEAALVDALRARLAALAARGAVAIWGAAAKGVTLANLVDPDRTLIACVVDLNPKKQGRFLPGTGHPIVAPSQLRALGVRTALLTNPNYFDENARLLREASLEVQLVDLMRVEADAHRD
jgi:SAM-dependent methyltransferase